MEQTESTWNYEPDKGKLVCKGLHAEDILKRLSGPLVDIDIEGTEEDVLGVIKEHPSLQRIRTNIQGGALSHVLRPYQVRELILTRSQLPGSEHALFLLARHNPSLQRLEAPFTGTTHIAIQCALERNQQSAVQWA